MARIQCAGGGLLLLLLLSATRRIGGESRVRVEGPVQHGRVGGSNVEEGGVLMIKAREAHYHWSLLLLLGI